MSYKSYESADEKRKNKRLKSKETNKQYLKIKQLWLEKGPVWFAENILTSPADVPPHPDYDPKNNSLIEDCPCGAVHTKFRENGTPYHIMLSADQRTYLDDMWKGVAILSLLAAGRGGGKTFIFAVRYCWLLATQDSIGITYMGGSLKQSKLCQGYIDDWRYDNEMLYKIIDRSTHGIERYMTTIWRGQLDFSACSPESARGPHVNEVGLDEVCVAEDKSEEGAQAVQAAMWQITGKKIGRLTLASTAHYIHGKFYEYMMSPDTYGFKVYKWAIAKYYQDKPAIICYTDKEPKHWLSNVWWITTDDVQKMRRAKSNEEWLCECLGEATMASGAVFKKDDLDFIICSVCDECEPFKWGSCPLIQISNSGTQDNPTQFIIDRRIGFDYGVSEAPCAITIVGRGKNDVVFVLYNEEVLSMREDEKVDWIHDNCQKYSTWTFIPDPAVAGKPLNEQLDDKGYAIYVIPEQEKLERVYNLINFIEKHKIVIPKAFWHLTQSMRKCAWDKDSKIRKVDDHSFDSLCYALVDWSVESETDIMGEFMRPENSVRSKDFLK